MIIVIDLIRNIFIIMFLVLLFLEIIVLISLTTLYSKPLNKSQNEVEAISFKKTKEILNSYNNNIIQKYYNIQTDLLLIAKHLYPMYLTQEYELFSTSPNHNYPRFLPQSAFYKSYNDCLIPANNFTTSSMFNKYQALPPQGSSPNFFFLEKLMKKYSNFSSMSEDQIISALFNESGFNQIVYYPEFTSIQTSDVYNRYICYAISIFKTLQIRNFIFEKNNLATKKYFLLLNSLFIQYPPDYLDASIISSLPFYSQDPQCKTKYNLLCFGSSFTSEQIESNYISNSTFFERPILMNGQIVTRGCLRIQFSNFFNENNPHNFACIDVAFGQMSGNFQQINNSTIGLILIYPYHANNISDLQVYSYTNLQFKDNGYKIYNYSQLGEYQIQPEKFEKYLLFHALYYEIFNFYQNSVSSQDLEKLITQYKVLKTTLIAKIDLLTKNILKCSGNETNANYTFEGSYLHLPPPNFAGSTTLEVPTIQEDTFQYVLTPIVINSSTFNSSYYMYQPQQCSKKIAFLSLARIRVGSKSIPDKIFFVLILKCIRSWFFFVSLLLFATIVYYIICQVYVKILIAPIKEIKQNLDLLIKDRQQLVGEESELEKFIKGKKENEINSTIDNNNLFRNQETKDLEKLLNFLKKINLMKQARGNDFGVQSQIFKRFSSNLINVEHKRQCELIIAYSNYKENKFSEAYSSLDNLKQMIESEESEILGKNETLEQKLINLPSQLKNELDVVWYLNEFTDNDKFDPENKKLIKLKILSQKMLYMYGLAKYSDFVKRKRDLKKEKLTAHERNQKLHDPDLYGLVEQAVNYLNEALRINSKMNFNPIKSIFILILISKCYYYMSEYNEAANHLKEALLKFSDFTKYLYEKNLIEYIDPKVMFVTNGVIMENILFHLGKVCEKSGKRQLAGWVFVKIIETFYFRTDEIHRNSCRKLIKFLNHKETKEIRPSRFLLEKICKRLDMPPSNKQICIVVSENLLKNFSSRYELREVLIKCIKKYVHDYDLISYFQFDRTIEKDTVIDENLKHYNLKNFETSKTLCQYSGNISSTNPKEKTDFYVAMKYAMQILCQNETSDTHRESESCDKYIFTFVYSEDFRFNSSEDNTEICKMLGEGGISLYTFCLDENISDKKCTNIKKFLMAVVEGVLIIVKNFKIIKQAFQNISAKGNLKNILQFNFENHKFIL